MTLLNEKTRPNKKPHIPSDAYQTHENQRNQTEKPKWRYEHYQSTASTFFFYSRTESPRAPNTIEIAPPATLNVPAALSGAAEFTATTVLSVPDAVAAPSPPSPSSLLSEVVVEGSTEVLEALGSSWAVCVGFTDEVVDERVSPLRFARPGTNPSSSGLKFL